MKCFIHFVPNVIGWFYMNETMMVEIFGWTSFGIYVKVDFWFTRWLDGELENINWFVLDD